jgi:hypothetical protein
VTDILASIIIPTANRDTDMSRAVSSALAQSVENIEVIVIDDASKDQTQDVLALLEEIDDRLRVLTLPAPLGISGGLQRNEGVKLARGKYICYLDDDDTYVYRAVEKRVEFLEANPELDYCWGASLFLRNHGTKEWTKLCRKRLVAEPVFGPDMPWQYGTVIPNELMHRAGVVGKSGIWWTPGRGEDQRLVQAFMAKGYKGKPIHDVIAIYGRHEAYQEGRVSENKALLARSEAAQRERLEKAGAAERKQPVPTPARMPETRSGKLQTRSSRLQTLRAAQVTQAKAAQVAVPAVRDRDEVREDQGVGPEGV